MTGGQVLAADVGFALDALGKIIDEHVVRLTINGSTMHAAFELCADEHERRLQEGVGAITSTALLCGLWLLPSGVPVAPGKLPDVKAQRLHEAPYAVAETVAGFERTYSPPGILRSVMFSGLDLERSVDRALRFTPIVQRFALFDQRCAELPSPVECLAREWGVGIIALHQEASPQELVPAMPAEVGVPSVYRWWVAELAYKSYLYDKTQLVS